VDSKVCGTDGVTYLNECHLKVAACLKIQLILVASKGDCELCLGVQCHYGGRCEAGQCVCPNECPNMQDPVCASDGRTYQNECLLQQAACGRHTQLRVVFVGQCQEFKEQMDSSMELGICQHSEHGCCPDGETPAVGPGMAGCPSICQCHRLGSYIPTCEPMTGQCNCRPGVGGARCDRCSPGYWGLQTIHHGHGGCRPCGCSLFGSVRDDCEQMSGQCVCKPGIRGKKCNLCPEGLVLRPKGCEPAKKVSSGIIKSCKILKCYLGAKCREESGYAKCFCNIKCPTDSLRTMAVCGSDGKTYRSECHLWQAACTDQRDVVVAALGKCTEPSIQSDDDMESPLRRSTLLSTEPHKDEVFTYGVSHGYQVHGNSISSTPVTFAAFGLLGSICYKNNDCSVPYSRCQSSICLCQAGYTQSSDRQTCVATTPSRKEVEGPCSSQPCHSGGTCLDEGLGQYTCECPPNTTGKNCEDKIALPYKVPSFTGASFLEIIKIKAYNKVQIELEFRSFTDSGILLYSQQVKDGSGDYISLALVDGYIEFRYNLGSGPAVIRSHQRIEKNSFHRIVAKRYQKDGILQLDDFEDATGRAPGRLKSLDLRGPTYIGYIPSEEKRIWENTGTSEGFVGCLKNLRINGRPIDIVWPGSRHVLKAEKVKECSKSPCARLPCKNQGTCRPLDNGHYKCLCSPDYSGEHCEVRTHPCESNPCQGGATCVAVSSDDYMCSCPPGKNGKLCEHVEKRLQGSVIPDFNGNGYLELLTMENVESSFTLEIWFLTRSYSGVLLYNGQRANEGISSHGALDFISLNINKGYVEFTFNLGSGHAKLVSPDLVSLNTWHVVRVRRKKRRGTLQLDRGTKVKGKSGRRLGELNLNLPLYIGGVENYTNVQPESGVKIGLNGAIQRLMVNSEVIENLVEGAQDVHGVRKHHGAPCLDNLCHNGGVCQPILNNFICKCFPEFTGKLCEESVSERLLMDPVKFTGQTFLKFPNLVYSSARSQTNNQFDISFRATSPDGLLVWINKGKSLSKDYLSLAINGGYVEFSFNLGKQDNLLFIRSKIRVDDGQWHTLVAHRRKTMGVLRVDQERPVKGKAVYGATTLNTNGKLWIGGAPEIPPGLPSAYYHGFRGCVDSIQVENRDLNIVSHGDARLINYCSEM
ncbi:unnamed protein product, partial [Meganyctiphanes norvegica]